MLAEDLFKTRYRSRLTGPRCARAPQPFPRLPLRPSKGRDDEHRYLREARTGFQHWLTCLAINLEPDPGFAPVGIPILKGFSKVEDISITFVQPAQGHFFHDL
jgi:hypothetical protein